MATLKVYRPNRRSVVQNDLPAYVAQTTDNGVIVVVPATTKAIKRTVYTGAYPRAQEIGIDYVNRATNGVLTVYCLASHGLQENDRVTLLDVAPKFDRDGGGAFLGVNKGSFEVEGYVTSILSDNSFTIQGTLLDAACTGVGGEVMVTTAQAAPADYPGPYVFDPTEGWGITASQSTSTAAIPSGRGLGSLAVSDSTQFPDEPGWLVVGFGTDYESAPIKYLGRLDATHLILDRQFSFFTAIPPGVNVTLLTQKAPWVPENPEEVGAFYVTGSAAGRVAAIEFLKKVMASGVGAKIKVVYPGDAGLGKESCPDSGAYISDKVIVWGSDDVDRDVEDAHG